MTSSGRDFRLLWLGQTVSVLGTQLTVFSLPIIAAPLGAGMAEIGVIYALNRAPYASVNHVAFEMPSIDAFMRGIGRMKTKGQAPAWGPGRHGPGNNPFAYFVSPSGFVIEFTSEVQQIDEATHQPMIWPRDRPDAMDVWMTAGPPTPAMRTVMQGRPDPGFATV